MLIKTFTLAALLWIIAPMQAHALGKFHFDLHAGLGKGSARYENKTKDKPVTYQYNAGATLGYKFLTLLYAGLSADYYYMIQTTKASSEWGNRKGTRYNLISPTLGFLTAKLHLKYDYQFKGKYTMAKKDSSGKEVYFEDPKGHRFYLGYRFHTFYELGLMYEKVLYEKQIIGTTESKLADDRKMEVKQIGLMLTAVF